MLYRGSLCATIENQLGCADWVYTLVVGFKG